MTCVPLVVLDACVLANFSLCDTLLRCAESPRLFEPKWSEEIIGETTRTLESKLNWPNSLAAYFQAELRAHFADAWISNYESLIPRMTKRVAMCWRPRSIEAPIIVTFNLRHFEPEHLRLRGIRALHPQSFLTEIFLQEQATVMSAPHKPNTQTGRFRARPRRQTVSD